MTLTPEQLDAIATKLLKWKPSPDAGKPFESYNGEWYSRGKWLLPDGSDRDDLRLTCPGIKGDAMLVLEAMGEWCDKQGELWYPDLQATCESNQWCCVLLKNGDYDGYDVMVDAELASTPAASIFACAAKLVERM